MWARFASLALGLWLMAAPAILGYGPLASDNDRIVGPLAVSVAIIAISEVTREVRWVSIPLGLWLLAAPWLLGYGLAPTINSLVVGLLLIALAFVRGAVEERFGGGWSSLLPGADDTTGE
jgi:general stress protein CsbA